MVVVVDQFFNETVQHADIVLPVTTTFEQWDVCSSYWHYWLSVNEPAIKPLYECKSDPEIAALLSAAINKIESGSCTFPQDLTRRNGWIWSSTMSWPHSLVSVTGKICSQGRIKQNAEHGSLVRSQIQNPSGKYEFKSERCVANGHTALPEYKEPAKSGCHFICLPRICSTACIRNLLISTGCKPSGQSRLSICIRWRRARKGLRKVTK
jgi:anaerobic selenocysteine-containing dehydrogenase